MLESSSCCSLTETGENDSVALSSIVSLIAIVVEVVCSARSEKPRISYQNLFSLDNFELWIHVERDLKHWNLTLVNFLREEIRLISFHVEDIRRTCGDEQNGPKHDEHSPCRFRGYSNSGITFLRASLSLAETDLAVDIRGIVALE